MTLQVPQSEVEAMKNKNKPKEIIPEPKKYASTYNPNRSDIE